MMSADEHAAGTGPLRVLVVDDHRDTANSMALLAGLWGHEARVAYDGAAALELARAFRPDVMLVDLSMPGTDGIAVARGVRQRPELRAVRLVAVTGHAEQAARDRAREAGFDFFLAKPAEPEAVRSLLDLLGRAALPAGGPLDLSSEPARLPAEHLTHPAA